ncbi:hypothetical protein NDU88_005284 [Pleurodeles waltl]|uniref:Uncharacterized protein n=1 Tax=Pleurodeles waltl TaxID=8319 RepID=A0AAV7WXG2_PLEWA|nr:hypothetical protein NDU88_005284 [Pleurodeles waltl]
MLQGGAVKITYGIMLHLERDIQKHEEDLGAIENVLHTHPDRLAGWREGRKLLLDGWRRLEKFTQSVSHQRLYVKGEKTRAMLARLEKTIAMLARLARQENQQTPLLRIYTDTGYFVSTQLTINGVFWTYQIRTYAMQGEGLDGQRVEYVVGTPLPSLDPENHKAIDSPIIQEEIFLVIQGLKTAKTSGVMVCLWSSIITM